MNRTERTEDLKPPMENDSKCQFSPKRQSLSARKFSPRRVVLKRASVTRPCLPGNHAVLRCDSTGECRGLETERRTSNAECRTSNVAERLKDMIDKGQGLRPVEAAGGLNKIAKVILAGAWSSGCTFHHLGYRTVAD